MSNIRFSSFPRTRPAPDCTSSVVEVFRHDEHDICTRSLNKGLTSDAVLALLRPELVTLGFNIEASKLAADKIKRPVFFGEQCAEPAV